LTYPSSLADKAVAAMLADDDFMDNYVSAYRRRLKAHYEYVTSLLKSEGIPCQPSNATLFVWANLRAVVKSKDVTDNQILSELKKQKLYITSGEGYRNEQSGWFRIVFAHPKNTLDEGLRRLLYTLSKL
jgi:aspartate/methionine/tyrosine aminotransferase